MTADVSPAEAQIIACLDQARAELANAFAADAFDEPAAHAAWVDRAYATLDHLDDGERLWAICILLARYAEAEAERVLHVPDTPTRSHRRKPPGRWSIRPRT